MLPSLIKISIPSSLEDDDFKKEVVVEGLPANESRTVGSTDESASLISSVSDFDFQPLFRLKSWDGNAKYSDFIADGLRYLKKSDLNLVMLYESPSSSSSDSTFQNVQVYRFHDWPPVPSLTKAVLGPCRYAMMNGSKYPTFLKHGEAPVGLMEHWEETVPHFVPPRFVSEITDVDQVYAYLPCESITHHVNDPHVHYHVAGKDAIHLMTRQSPKLLNGTNMQRPCIAKTTHSMGSRGIFVIRNDQDQAEFETFLHEAGNPTFVVTEFIEIERNVACHFFMHPNGTVTFFGSNENHVDPDTGRFSLDSYLIQNDQDDLRAMQLPFVMDVVNYCRNLGFWGFAGIDVLFDKTGQGYLVDVNPRVTGSCPSLMVAKLFKDKYGFDVGLFRRSGKINFHGSSQQLFEQVTDYNQENEGHSKIVIFSVMQTDENLTKINIGVYGNSLEECRNTLNRFAQPKILEESDRA